MSRLFRSCAVLAAALALGIVAGTGAAVHSFPNIAISGANIVPTPVASDGGGTANVVYNDVTNTIYYTVNYTLDSSSTQLIAAHFHGPADAASSAGPRLTITPLSTSPSGAFSGSAVIDSSMESELLAGLWYINLHSDQHPLEEMRGQAIEAPATHSLADLPVDSSQQEPPAPVGSPGAGLFNGTYDDATNLLTFTLTWNSLTSLPQASHFHGPALPGLPGGPEISVHLLPGFDASSTTGQFTSNVILDSTQEGDLLAGLWYINIHTVNNANGEVRGQLDSYTLVPVELSVFHAD